MTARRRAPDPDELAVERVGLGYVGTLVSQGVTLALDRIYETRGEIVGELTVERAPEGHLLRARFSASSRADREQTAIDLGKRSNNIVWRDVLEQFCLRVLDQERGGQPFIVLGEGDVAEEVLFCMRPILPLSRPVVVFGEGGVGKSTVAAAVAVSVASGLSAVEGWTVEQPGPVLVLDWEADHAEWSMLIASIANGLGIEVPKNIHYRRGTGPLPDQLPDIAQHVAQHGTVLVIVDSVGLAMPSRAEGADANEGALKLFSALRHLQLTTLLVDHIAGVNMGAERGAPKMYGSVYKWNLARNVFELRAQPDPPEDSAMHVGLYHRKSNRTAKVGPIGLAVHHSPGEILITTEELDSIEANPAIGLASRIHTLLLAGGKTARDIAKAVGSSEGTVRTTLNRLAAEGRVTKLKARQGREIVWAAAVPAGVHLSGEVQHVTQHVTDVDRGKSELWA